MTTEHGITDPNAPLGFQCGDPDCPDHGQLGSIVTADMHDAVRIIEAKAERWAALRDALTELQGEA